MSQSRARQRALRMEQASNPNCLESGRLVARLLARKLAAVRGSVNPEEACWATLFDTLAAYAALYP